MVKVLFGDLYLILLHLFHAVFSHLFMKQEDKRIARR